MLDTESLQTEKSFSFYSECARYPDKCPHMIYLHKFTGTWQNCESTCNFLKRVKKSPIIVPSALWVTPTLQTHCIRGYLLLLPSGEILTDDFHFHLSILLLILHFSINSRYSCTGDPLWLEAARGRASGSEVLMRPFSTWSLQCACGERLACSSRLFSCVMICPVITIFLQTDMAVFLPPSFPLSSSLSLLPSLSLSLLLSTRAGVASPPPQRDDHETPHRDNDIHERLSDGCPPD